MNNRSLITERDVDILTTLKDKTGKLSLEQIARTWFRGSRGAAANRVRVLESSGLIESMFPTTHPEIELSAPHFSWRPGEQPPAGEQLSWKLKSRWSQPPKRTRIIIPTKKTVSILGGEPVRPSRSRAILHDLHVASIYLRFLRRDRLTAEGWIHETNLYRNGFGRDGLPLPDAVIELDELVAIDFGGAYSAAKIRKIHNSYEKHNMAYQIW